MNNVFRVVFDKVTGAMKAVGETAKVKHVVASVLFTSVIASGSVLAGENEGTVWNKAGDIFVNTTDGTSSNLNAVAGKVITVDDQLGVHDARGNELSDQAYAARLEGQSALHYDNDKVVKTDKDLMSKTDDKIGQTSQVMKDRDGNALKVREIQKGTDDITFRGDNGTSLHNVAAGVEPKDAVNVSQLKATAQGLQNSIDGHGETLKSLDAAQQKESQDRIQGYKENSQRITTVAEQKADKNDVNEVREALSRSTSERISTDANHDSKISDLYDTKANAAEVNEWLETKADKSDLNVTNQNIAGNTTLINAETRNREAQGNKIVSDQSVVNNNVKTSISNLQSTKVGRDEFKDEQDRQDAALAQEVKNRTTDSERLDSQKADKKDVKDLTSRISTNEAKTWQHGLEISDLNNRTDNVEKTAGAALSVGNEAYNNSINNAEAIKNEHNDSVARDVQTLKNANGYTDRTRNELRSEIGDVRKEGRAGTAAAISLGQLQTPIHADKNIISVGVGSWKGQNAVSVGAGRRWGDQAEWSAKGGVSFSSRGQALGGSVGYEF